MKIRTTSVISFLVVFFILAGILLFISSLSLPQSPHENLNVQSTTLYSIDGVTAEMHSLELPYDDLPRFRRFPVFGEVELSADEQQTVLTVIDEGIANSDGAMAACFWPRHGLRVNTETETIDYVICFECLQIAVYRDGFRDVIAITDEGRAVLNEVLTHHGIPVVPDHSKLLREELEAKLQQMVLDIQQTGLKE